MYLITGVLLGFIFEVFFISVMFYKIKGLKDKKIALFLSTLITFIITAMITGTNYSNQYLFYLIYNVILFGFLKIIYRNKINIIDLFLIYYIIMIINFTCLIMMKIIGYNYLFLFSNRLLLIVIMLISSKINPLYEFYLSNWNRHSNNKIKSITLRNITIISCNLMLYIINYFVLNYLIVMIS